jgi:hypothetical protein
MRGQFGRGLDFERTMVARLRADAALPRAQRLWLKDFDQPRIETHVGVAKADAAGVRYADVLVIEANPPPGTPLHVETFSFKSRNFKPMNANELGAQLEADANNAVKHYGRTLNIRRRSLGLTDVEVQVQRIRLIYEGGELRPGDLNVSSTLMEAIEKRVKEVEVSFQ